jgi:hypothetical protein
MYICTYIERRYSQKSKYLPLEIDPRLILHFPYLKWKWSSAPIDIPNSDLVQGHGAMRDARTGPCSKSLALITNYYHLREIFIS